jgi:dTDP-4-dehydrorhamnose 3,5-epimerase
VDRTWKVDRSTFRAVKLAVPDVIVFEPIKPPHWDEEFSYTSFDRNEFSSLTGQTGRFVQDNESESARGVARGLHFQTGAFAQGKLVRVVGGSVFDVAVDLRRSSPTFGKWASVVLTSGDRKQVWIPPGFAHGFQALEDQTLVSYKVTEYYSKEHERAIRWNDPLLAIDWPISEATVSERDAAAMSWSEFLGADDGEGSS